jgi:hypothetical protein
VRDGVGAWKRRPTAKTGGARGRPSVGPCSCRGHVLDPAKDEAYERGRVTQQPQQQQQR